MTKNSLEDTIAAISTPIGEGGIGIVRISGRRALNIADKIFVSKDGAKPSKYKTYTVHYGHITNDRKRGRQVDEVLLTVMKRPKSYTKEDIVEINCHGGIEALKQVLDLVIGNGARVAEPGEFTKRAFLNGRLDLAQAEAVLDMIKAKTDRSLEAAASQLEGGLSKKVNEILEDVIGVASQIEASIDFPEEELDIVTAVRPGKVDGIISSLKSLIDSFGEGIVLREGVLAVICGKPNVGKSSLMNLLLKRDRVIVTPIPGTTRDAVEEMIDLKGIPIRLVDTAGIGHTEDAVEKEGIKRSKGYLEMADMALVMFDASTPIDKKDMDIIKLTGKKKKVVVINKIDKPVKINKKKLKDIFKDDIIVEISVDKKKNIALLEKAISDTIWSGSIRQGEGAIVTNARHKELLDKALTGMSSVKGAMKQGAWPEVVAVDLKEVIFNLGLVVGRSVSDDILDRVFGEFCIGK
ncbi:MAG: tRNA uridine-5-carboxymethylaminomethyl(34) synthesis GTPase MnmE [Candidatus Omnitrophota bacterium]|jgi:tRNA modification GTPase